MRNLFRRKIASNNWLFNNNYIDVKGLYLYYNGTLPCVSYITDLEIDRAYAFLLERLNTSITEVLQHCMYNYEEGRSQFNVSILVLISSRMIEVGSDYIMLLHPCDDYNWAAGIMKELAAYRKEETKPGKIGFVQSQSMN
jgi:hypothetical protein